MKQILPILTLTTLTAAAFADASAPAAAASAGLSYNRVGVNYVTNGTDHPYSVSASAFIGSSNVLVAGEADLTAAGDDTASIGYVFKGVAAGIDATVSVASNDIYGINLRRSLGEVLSGLEAAIGYQSSSGSNKNDSWTYELSYNVNKQYSVAYSIQDFQGSVSNNSVSIRYNF